MNENARSPADASRRGVVLAGLTAAVAAGGHVMRGLVVASLLVASLALPAAARAMNHDVHVMWLCELAVARVKPFSPPVWDRHREMLMGSCLHNRGTIPGAVAHEPALSGRSSVQGGQNTPDRAGDRLAAVAGPRPDAHPNVIPLLFLGQRHLKPS